MVHLSEVQLPSGDRSILLNNLSFFIVTLNLSKVCLAAN
jgi:hypothetical protein